MATVNIYLTFQGQCKAAFDFYRSVFGGDFSSISTFAEMPPQEGMPPIPDEMKDHIMHVTLPISKETVLMGSDTGGEWGAHLKIGNNFSISINTQDQDEATSLFNALAAGGKVTMPLDETFWNAYFGMLTDKFGINWMVNCDLSSDS
jgi:PhnB protein